MIDINVDCDKSTVSRSICVVVVSPGRDTISDTQAFTLLHHTDMYVSKKKKNVYI